jgi:histidine triad (HIT) family protein
MKKHAPHGYVCPFCALAGDERGEGLLSTPRDIICRNENVLAFVASHWWEKNPGHAIVAPVRHYENLYELPDEVGAQIFAMSRRIAIAMKVGYRCDGVSTRQHNEPAGNQEIWHFHLHVFPRYLNDDLYRTDGQKRLTTPGEREPFAATLRVTMRERGNAE